MYARVKNKFKEIRDYWVIRNSGLFDRSYYLRHNLDVARSCVDPIKHFIRHGWREGRNPHDFFDTQWYMNAHPDVKKSGRNPLCHYIQYGIKEGRRTIEYGSEIKTGNGGTETAACLSELDVVSQGNFRCCRPITCVIDHDLGGGANHYRYQLIEKLLLKGDEILVLNNVVSFGEEQGYQLTLFSGKEKKIVMYQTVDELFLLLEKIPIRKVFYNSLVYYGELELFLKKLVTWSKSGVEIIMAIHDFFPVCPSYNLINSKDEFCGLVSISQCPSCLKAMSLEHMKKPIDILLYKQLWHDVLRSASKILCFSRTSETLIKKAYPLLDDNKFEIAPHSMEYFKPSRVDIKKNRNNHLKIGIAGDIYSVAKGARFVDRFSSYLLKYAPQTRIYIFGRYDGTNKNIVHIGRYNPDQLSDLMTKHDIDIAFIPSVWPETFSYLTSEMIMIGMPLVCFDFGAQAEKVRSYEYGAVIPNISEQSAYDTIIHLYDKVY